MSEPIPLESEAPVHRAGARDLTQGPVVKTLVAFALPSLLVNVLQSVNGTIASIFIGKMLGEAALAASANANMIMFVVFATVFGFAMAATILVGHAAGRHDMDEVRRTTGASVGLFLIAGIILAGLGWWGTPHVLKLLATPDQVIGPATAYMRVICLGLPVSLVNMLLPSLLRGIGDAVSPLRATALNVAVGTFSCPLLINAMGIEGAGVAALLANVSSVAYQLMHVYRTDMAMALRGPDLSLLKPDWGHARPLLTLGFPMGISMIVMGVSQMGMIGLINREGMNTVAAYGAIGQLWGFLQMPAVAVGSAVSAMAAQNIGAGRWDRIDRTAWGGIGINLLMTGSLVLLITLFQRPLLGLFLPVGSPAIEIGAHINLILGWTHVFLGVSTIVTSIVRANGAMFWPLVNLFCSAVLLRFSIGLLGHPYWGADAIWASFGAHALVSTLWSLAYYRWGRWREAKGPMGGRSVPPGETGLA